MNDTIITYIKEELSAEPLENIGLDEDLLGGGIVDSLGMMKLVLFLEKEFHIKIDPGDMTVENFMTIRNITDYIAIRISR